jgi:D-lactate dehydrogenase (cytochrome)
VAEWTRPVAVAQVWSSTNGTQHRESLWGYGWAAILTTMVILSQQQFLVAQCAEKGEKAEGSLVVEKPAFPLDEFLQRLRSIVTTDQIDLDEQERRSKGKPWNSYHTVDAFPHVIVSPNNTDEVSRILALCYALQVPVVPYGGGTSLEGQLLAPQGGLSLDFSNMKRVVAIHEQDLDVTVEAGLGYVELNEILKPLGLWFPLDPGPGASIGGMCACRCSGSTAVRYGSMRENVLSLTAVLADGTVIKTGSRARKCSAGYDLARLLVGSEGTLAVITEATLKIYGIPKVSHALRVSYPTTGVAGAARTARDSLNCGVVLGRCELLDDEMIKIVNAVNPGHVLGHLPEYTTLLFEVTGISESAVQEQEKLLLDIAARHGGEHVAVYSTLEESTALWRLRKECLWSAMSVFPAKEPMITDVCVPLTELPALIADTKVDIAQSGLPCPIIAHAGDGNFHVLIFFDPKNAEEVYRAKQLSANMALRAIELGGTCTGEHGVGVGKKEFLVKELGSNTIAMMNKIKWALDDKSILNPGKVFDVQPLRDCSHGCNHSSNTPKCG